MATTAPGKRVLTRDLDVRLRELEEKADRLAEQLSQFDERVGKIADSLAHLDERVTRIANSLAQLPFSPGR